MIDAIRVARDDDRYPSRLGGPPGLTERLDPVVWPVLGDEDTSEGSSEVSGPLDADHLDRYRRDGYVHLPALLSPGEVAALSVELQRLAGDPAVVDDPRTILERGSQEVRSVFEVHRDGPFAALCRDRRLAGVARQLVGSDVYLHQSRINLKPGFRGRDFSWHSDFETWHTEDGMASMRAVSCSVGLTENRHVNGPLLVIAGSHRWFASCAGETPPDHHQESLRRQEVGVPDDEQLLALARRGEVHDVVGPAGSVTFFDCNLMHGSNGNITPYPRRNAFFVFNSVDNALTEPFAASAPRPEHIASRRWEPIPNGP